jgi:selenocysteine lyase/cysteine desulfurase
MPSSWELDRFIAQYPAYQSTSRIDALRASEYSRLDRLQHVYLDYTGGGLYADSQIQRHHQLLSERVYGNPHSSNPSSQAATQLVEDARDYILKFFNASPEEYTAIFTSNASGALKLVGESYPFSSQSNYLLTFDNHNSVNGIREYAHARGARVTYIPVCLPDLRADEEQLFTHLDQPHPGHSNLFAFPAQSNFSGVHHPLEWIEQAHQRGWDVLVDAAAFAPTNRLDLSRWKPDFIPLSFYKIFGYPTGVGALIARRSALAKLRRPWFAGGTITVASVQGDRFYLAEGHAAFEDGTLDYLNIPAVRIGLEHIEQIGIYLIHERVRCLTDFLLTELTSLQHKSGAPLARVYGPTNTDRRGGAVTVNFFNANGSPIDHRVVEQAANRANISLRTGCFCNPGAGEVALGISKPELLACFSQPGHDDRLTLDDFRLCIDGKFSGAVRVSVGMVSNHTDIVRFLQFAEGLIG